MLTQAFTALVLAGAVLAQEFSITTPPSIQQCQPAAFSWQGGTAPFILAAIPQGQTSAPALATIAENLSGNSYTWTVNLPQGTAINVRITDATGAINYSSGLTVQAGSNGCLSGSASSAASTASASAGSNTSAPPPSTTSAPSASSAASSSAAAASSTSRSASSASSALSGSASGSGTSRPASSGGNPTSSGGAAPSATSTGAGFAKAAFNLPVFALAGAGAFVFLGGFAALA